VPHSKTNPGAGDAGVGRNFGLSSSPVPTASPSPPSNNQTEARSGSALARYDAACRALAEARLVDEVKDIRNKAVAMAACAKQAKNRDIRLRATRRLDSRCASSRRQRSELAKGGGGKHGRKRVAEKPTLKDAGIDKNLANEGRKLGALSEVEFKQKLAEARDTTTRAARKLVKSITLPEEETDRAETEAKVEITLKQWEKMSKDEQRECLDPKNFPSNVTFNRQTGPGIEWAQESYNVLTGCKHDCPYCYARDIALRYPNAFPHGFEPTFRPHMLNAPYNTPVPPEAAFDTRIKNVFTGSMSDNFGGWVPREWIEAMFKGVWENPQWAQTPQRVSGTAPITGGTRSED
jgi:hypothetical protein